MNKSVALIISLLLAVGVIGLSLWGLFAPSNTVKVSLPDDVESITIDDETRSDGQTFNLDPGEYTYRLKGVNIDDSSREITIAPNMDELSISYAPYSTTYLAELLQSEESTISSLVIDRYVDKVDSYRLYKIQLIDRGQFAAVIIAPDELDIDNPVNIYRLVLKKSDDSWQVVGGPELLLTVANTKGIDKHILQEVNNLAL